MVHFHLRNAESWGNERVGIDLAAQVDPDFVLDESLITTANAAPDSVEAAPAAPPTSTATASPAAPVTAADPTPSSPVSEPTSGPLATSSASHSLV